MQAVRKPMRPLLSNYTNDIRVEKLTRAYAHVYDHYFGAGESSYGQRAIALDIDRIF